MDTVNQQEELTAEELSQKKDEMLDFYKDSMPYLEAQLNYEKKLCEIDEMRFKRANIQMQYAMMMAPPEDIQNEDSAEETNQQQPKERKLKK